MNPILPPLPSSLSSTCKTDRQNRSVRMIWRQMDVCMIMGMNSGGAHGFNGGTKMKRSSLVMVVLVVLDGGRGVYGVILLVRKGRGRVE
ncbi:hypothetical protein L6452_00696 [Arctium lappa]|uniref:Uncharacterized protein n=1 Tax=Arctium lappa TaxID=4217 RepID=A0ACB9FG24_ARCLA|nr:hypothetical protein L6452_00696 [Arctium lappa]